MRRFRRRILQAGAAGLCAAVGFLGSPQSTRAADQGSAKAAEGSAKAASAALDKLDAWLGPEENGNQWRAYLNEAELRGELTKGNAADPTIVARDLQRFQDGSNGLELAPFVAARKAVGQWLHELKQQYGGDLAKLADLSRADHAPITEAEFGKIRSNLRDSVRALEAALAKSPNGAGWTKYLQLESLKPALADDFTPTAASLAEIDEILRRFHTNEVGLEQPVFTNVAKAMAKYRALASWAVTAKTRDTRPVYEGYLNTLKQTLEHHKERGSIETTRTIARTLGIIDSLGQSPELVDAARAAYAQPNVFGVVSANFVTKSPNRPIDRTTPVRDCILGTSIFGTASTVGSVHYVIHDSPDTVLLSISLNGEAHSKTQGYNGPVRVNSSGLTTFWATEQVTLSDEEFASSGATADANTHTHINSIQKTGGQFAHKLIEKIAWKRAGEQKGQAEQISSGHTRDRVLREFQEAVAKDLAESRERYDAKIRYPLVRRGVTPEYLRMSSGAWGVGIQTLFAARNQLGAQGPPPQMMPGHDLAVQIHESAVNNYLPLALASARISQEKADVPPALKGNVPNWLKLTAIATPKLAAAASAGAEMVGEAQERVQQAIGAEPNAPPPPFKPYSITLNGEAPASVHFDDGKIEIRVRAAQLQSEDSDYKNWDFLVVYQITQEGNRILLKRVGEIEAFPSNFDLQWPRQLNAEETGFRSVLKKNMNARANAGQSFPKEIPIEPVRFSRFGVLVLQELVADDGWLTVGWGLPSLGAPSTPEPTLAPTKR